MLPVVIPELEGQFVSSSTSYLFPTYLSPMTLYSTNASPCYRSVKLICSALEGADVFCHYHPNEEQDAKDTVEYIKKVAPNAKVETYAKDLRTEAACLEMVEEVKKWSGGKLDIL